MGGKYLCNPRLNVGAACVGGVVFYTTIDKGERKFALTFGKPVKRRKVHYNFFRDRPVPDRQEPFFPEPSPSDSFSPDLSLPDPSPPDLSPPDPSPPYHHRPTDHYPGPITA
jgi:hypothetical protein